MKKDEVVITDVLQSLLWHSSDRLQRAAEGKHVTEREWTRKGDEGKSCVKRELRVGKRNRDECVVLVWMRVCCSCVDEGVFCFFWR